MRIGHSLRSIAVGIVFVALSLAFSGCAFRTDRLNHVGIDDSNALSEAIIEASGSDEAVLISSLTDFQWSTVSVIEEYTTDEDIDAILGFEAASGTFFNGRYLLVFCSDSSVVASYTFNGPVALEYSATTYSSNVSIVGRYLHDAPGVVAAPDCH